MKEFANFIVWASVLQWLAIAGVFTYDAARAYLRSRRQHKTALGAGNGRLFVAKKRRVISRWILVGSSIALSIGLLSAYSNAFLPHPPADTRIAGVVIREGIVVMLFGFWRATRNSVLLQHEADTRVRRANAMQAADVKVGRIEQVTADTNMKVTRQGEQIEEMQRRGQSDQPFEQTDREEGHRHRAGIDEALKADTERRATEREEDRQERKEERKQDREERAEERRDL